MDFLNEFINKIATESVNCGEAPVLTYECRGCGRTLRTLEWDGYCRYCAGVVEDEAELVERQRAAAAKGRALTVRLLRRLGHHDRAEVHEREAER